MAESQPPASGVSTPNLSTRSTSPTTEQDRVLAAGSGSVVVVRPPTARLAGLDGIRGLAALFVVMHHCWLTAFPGFPYAETPAWTGWLAYGHLAVVVFIVLSGFSLAVGPARAGWRLGSLRRFLQRRAWRILPPYWAALLFSLAVAWTVVPQPGERPPDGKSVVVYGFLLQDIFGSPSPNGAFWSIAIEAQLYFLLPLMLLVRRRLGSVALLGAVALPAIAIEVLAGRFPLIGLFERLVPQMAVLFTLGVIAASAVGPGRRLAERAPWAVLVPAAALPPVVLSLVQGRAWSVSHYFWVDLLVGPAVAMVLAALSVGGLRRSVRVLDIRPLRRLGSFSYSLYLVHAPIVAAMDVAVGDRIGEGLPRLLALLVAAVPLTLLLSWLFAQVFELPFQRHRSWHDVVTAVRRPVSVEA